MCWSVAGAQASAQIRNEPLALAKASPEVQTIPLDPLANGEGHYRGRLTLTLVNRARSTVTPTVAYFQDAGPRSDPLHPQPGDPARLGGASTIKLAPRSPKPVRFVFDLPADQPATWLDGELIFRSPPAQKGGTPIVLVVKVSGRFQTLQEVTATPSPLTIQVTKWPNSSGRSEVELSGSGARSLLARKPPFSTRVLLAADNGSELEATLGDLKERHGSVRGTVSLDRTPSPGEYKGSFALGAGKEAPTLSLVVKSHLCVLWFILLVFFSALLGGLLPKLARTAQRRTLMKEVMRKEIEAYEEKRDKPGFVAKLPWDMDERMGARPWLGQQWSAVPGAGGYSGLYGQLRWARGEAELDELSKEVTAAVLDLESWAYLYEVALPLRELEQTPALTRNGTPWRATRVARDTEGLLKELRSSPPATREEAKKLYLRCVEQTAMHRNVLDAWTTIASAQADPDTADDVKEALRHLDFNPVFSLKPEHEREPEETGAMTAALRQLAADARTADPGLPEFQIEAGSDQNVQWAVQQEAAMEADQAPTPAQPRAIDSGTASERTLALLRYGDWAVTLLIALGAVIAYVAPLYSSTWGDLEDILTAAAAGFGTQLAIEWAAVPLLQSIRLQKSSGTDGPAAADAVG